MFTGIIEEMGTIENIAKGAHSAVLTINARKILEDVHIGDSIAVNGVCLTVTSFDHERFTADVMHETLNRSALAQCKRKSPVNLERAMSANGRFGGHIVAGHVDATGQIAGRKQDDNAIWIRVEAPPEVLRYVVEKGSVTIDGISLTVASIRQNILNHTRSEVFYATFLRIMNFLIFLFFLQPPEDFTA